MIYKYKLYVIIFIKMLLLYIFSSDYYNILFKPFVKVFIDCHCNPWEYYLENNLNSDAFPYHGLMLFIFTPFAFIENIASVDLGFIFKIPLLLADMAILFVFLKLFPNKTNKVYIFYFLNPIIIYTTYIHSQLDIIPTAFLFLSIFFLISYKVNMSALFFGFALATKIHTIVAAPLVLFYAYNIFKINIILRYVIFLLLVLAIFDLPFLFSNGFINMVIFNKTQTLIFDTFFNIGSLKVYFSIFTILIVYFYFFNQSKINRDLLFFYFGLVFMTVIFFVYPAPAWYIWAMPFIIYYFIINSDQIKIVIIYVIFLLLYLVFFIFFYISNYNDILFFGTVPDIKIDSDNLRNISFTALETSLLVIMYIFCRYGIKSNSLYGRYKNLVIGVSGDSGSGKSTILRSLQGILGNKLLFLEGDAEHKWERNSENWSRITHLNPKANYIHKQVDSILELKNNRSIFRRDYDHRNGRFTELKKIKPKQFIAIAGLHSFYLPKIRKNIDLKIYLDTDEQLRRHWKILRDTSRRGHDINTILRQINARVSDAAKYIYPQKDFADMVIRFFAVDSFKIGDMSNMIHVGLKIVFDANIQVEDIVNRLNCDFVWDYNCDLKTQFIEFLAPPNLEFVDIATEVVDNIDEILSPNPIWHSGYNGFIQLLLLKAISEKLKDLNNE